MDHQSPLDSGNSIRVRRVSQGLTQRALAKRCSDAGYPVSYSQISKVERGVSDPWPSTLFGIAQGLGTTVTELGKPLSEAAEVAA